MLAPVHSLGPGERVCLWVQGCGRGCPGCISPELQPRFGRQTDEGLLAEILRGTARRSGCDGLTLSGGDPLEQPEALARLLPLVRGAFPDILVYTGYTLAEIRAGRCGPAGRACLDWIDVLIDGPYIDSRNMPECTLRGSDNQAIHFLTPRLRERYEPYLRQGRVLESFSHGGRIVITGIQNRRDQRA